MKNKVIAELGPDLASSRGECTILPPYTGVSRSFLFDGHVVGFVFFSVHKMSCGVCRQCYLSLPPRAQHCRFCDWFPLFLLFIIVVS